MTPKSSALPVGPTPLELMVQSARVANRDADLEGTRLSWKALATIIAVAKRDAYAECLEDTGPQLVGVRVTTAARTRYMERAAAKYPLPGVTLARP